MKKDNFNDNVQAIKKFIEPIDWSRKQMLKEREEAEQKRLNTIYRLVDNIINKDLYIDKYNLKSSSLIPYSDIVLNCAFDNMHKTGLNICDLALSRGKNIYTNKLRLSLWYEIVPDLQNKIDCGALRLVEVENAVNSI